MPLTTDTRPIVERIAQELFARLELLLSGYKETSPVVEVLRLKRLADFTYKHYQIVLTQSDPEENEALSLPGNPPAVAYDITFNVRLHVHPSDKDPTPIDELLNVFVADVMEVITEDGTSGWWQFNGLAINAQIGAPEQVDADGGYDGVMVPVHVTYRHSEYSPYELRT